MTSNKEEESEQPKEITREFREVREKDGTERLEQVGTTDKPIPPHEEVTDKE